MFDFKMLNRIRVREIAAALPHIPKGSRVLEIGAGTGEQSKMLSKKGHKVTAVDIEGTEYQKHCAFPVTYYNVNGPLPVKDGSIDVVFSSTVLEHVPNLDALHDEFRRVLKPDGFCVHILPTPTWRIWTTLAGPFDFPARVSAVWKANDKRFTRKTLYALAREAYIVGLPHLHGERGNAITEIYHFSKRSWTNVFRKSGFEVQKIEPVGMFYTGWLVLGERLPVSLRTKMARVMGSSCRVYVVKPLPRRRKLKSKSRK